MRTTATAGIADSGLGGRWKAIATALGDQGTAWRLKFANKTNPPGLSRSSRTDKGVHALGNILGIWLPVSASESDEQEFCSAVNAALPEDIRLLRRIPVPSSFNARICCEARRYHYLVPFVALKPAGAPEEDVMTLRKRFKKVLLQWGGTHDFVNFSRVNGTMQAPAAAAPAAAAAEEDDDDEAAATVSTKRHVLRCFFETILELSGTQYAVVSISGQSFMYHQIRKMMGASIGAICLAAASICSPPSAPSVCPLLFLVPLFQSSLPQSGRCHAVWLQGVLPLCDVHAFPFDCHYQV